MTSKHLFFFFDRLKITKAERVSLLTVTMLLLATLLGGAALQPPVAFDDRHYAEVDSLFRLYAATRAASRSEIMARYEPPPLPGNTAVGTALAVRPTGITTQPEKAAPAKTTSTKPAAPAPGSIPLNKADAAGFARLPGIGPKTAQAIVDFRQANGPFAELSHLTRVKGIGPKKWEQIRPYLRLD